MNTRSAEVSGIVVNFRTPELTARAVQSLLEDGVGDVVVVENGSGDASPARLAELLSDDARTTLLVSGDNLGFGRGVNLGAASTTSEYLFVLNSDATVQPGCTNALLAALDADPAVAVAAPMVVDANGHEQPDAHGVFPSLRALVARTNRHPPDVDDPDWVSGVAMLVRRADFVAVDGFDPRYFMYFEDIDLCRRFRLRDRGARRVRAATVVHQHASSKQSETTFLDHYYAAQRAYVEAAGWPRWKVSLLRALRLPVAGLRRLHSTRAVVTADG